MKHLRYLLMAALVAMPLTACDEDTNPVVIDPIYGTVTGTVSAEGTGLSGVSVSLVGATSQSATTGAGGTYTFTNVEAGSYGVAIDAATHADVSFSQTSKTTTITTSGETATVDFTGSYIRTATITGVVTATGTPLGGIAVKVTGGPDNVTKNSVTNAGGEYFATGLRAGNYTVTITPPAGRDLRDGCGSGDGWHGRDQDRAVPGSGRTDGHHLRGRDGRRRSGCGRGCEAHGRRDGRRPRRVPMVRMLSRT